MTQTHHKFSPSRLEQLRLCPGAYRMQQGVPEEPSEWAAEGTRLHAAVAAVASGADLASQDLDSEQSAQVAKCVAFLETLVGAGMLHLEQAVSVHRADGEELTSGTADAVIEGRGVLTVIDWKFGYHPVAEVSRNIQLAAYAAGAMEKFGFESCECWVFQPRIGEKSRYCFSKKPAIVANIETIIRRATADRMILNPEEPACRYCAARLKCPAFCAKFQNLVPSGGDCDLSKPEQLLRLYEASRGVKTFINAIEQEMRHVIERDGRCGGYVLRSQEGPREVRDPAALYSALREYLTPGEFTGVCKVALGKLETLVADKLVTQALAAGETLTRTAAGKRCRALIGDFVARGNPVTKIVKEAEYAEPGVA